VNEAPIATTGRRPALGSVAFVLGSYGYPAAVPVMGGMAQAGELATATFASGKFTFMEYEFLQLKYAGVVDVVPGYLGDDRIEAVQVTYDTSRISFEALMRTYWKHCNPTQAGGQFKEVGANFISAVQVSSSAMKELVETQKGKLERSGIFGNEPIVTKILDGPPLQFDPIPVDQRGTLKTLKLSEPKKFEKLQKESGRLKYFDQHFGFVQFCKDKVCGYVRFAPRCVDECEDVFPEYRESNFGQPLLEGDIKLTGGTFR